jgi:site-specific recombinase XerD
MTKKDIQSTIANIVQLPLYADFFLQLKVNNYSKETLYNYRRDLELFIEFLTTTNTTFESISKLVMNKYKATLQDKKLDGQSINRHLSSIRSYLRFLIEMDYAVPLPPDAITLVKTTKKTARVPDLHELIALIEYPEKIEEDSRVGLRNRVMLELLFSTGLRISELISLNRTHIDDSGRIFVLGKGKKERFVYLTPRAYTHIKRYLAIRTDSSPALFVPYKGKNIHDKNRRVSTNYLQMKIKQYRELLHINVPISAHTIRHSFATYLAEEGANPAAIQVLLGHESLNTTTRYVHASDRYAEKIHTDHHPLKK